MATATKERLTYKEAAAYLGIGVRTLQTRVANGDIPYLKLGHMVRFDRTDLDAYLSAHKVTP